MKIIKQGGHRRFESDAQTTRVVSDMLLDLERHGMGVMRKYSTPTSRAPRYTGGVWVGKFLKTCTYQRMTPAASREVAEVTARQCEVERMLAHAITAQVRAKRYGDGATINRRTPVNV